jgi:porphobilinogen synthase
VAPAQWLPVWDAICFSRPCIILRLINRFGLRVIGGMEKRLRRLRISPPLRKMTQECHILAADLIYPLFVVEGVGVRREVASMPGVYNLSVDQVVREVGELTDLGILAVILFGIPGEKDELASQAYDDRGVVQRAVRAIKASHPSIFVITDVCLCEYTSHGHCGILDSGRIQNDPTVALLAKAAVSHAQAGADMVAPSDMMDLTVASIRRALDDAGFAELPVMSYAAKYASGFYGPFRDAAQSTPSFGDRKTHQMNPGNLREALREVEEDIAEGADVVIVKPALSYLDVVRAIRDRFDVPIAAYQVSGEYAMIKAAAQRGWIDEPRVIWETLVSIKRAGADMVISYFAKDFLSGKLRYRY